jgi:hypothetical protein
MKRKPQRRRPPARAELDPQSVGRDRQHHDVLVFPSSGVVRDWEYFRVPVTKQFRFNGGEEAFAAGEFNTRPEKWDLSDNGQRGVLAVARPQDYGDPDKVGVPRGAAFATLPIKPDPNSASFPTCFLINVRNLDTPNLWTVEEWNDGPSGPNFPTPEHANEFEVMLAGPRGRVFRLKVRDLDGWTFGTVEFPNKRGEIEAIDLRNESEIWSQLRGGLLAGRVLFQDTSEQKRGVKGYRTNKRVVPLVNITALEPSASPETK